MNRSLICQRAAYVSFAVGLALISFVAGCAGAPSVTPPSVAAPPAPSSTLTVVSAPTTAPIASATPNRYAPRITLNDSQRKRLIETLNSNPEAKTAYGPLMRLADRALSVKPNPIAKIEMAGKLDSDPVMIKSRESMKDITMAYALGLASAITGDSKYNAKAKEFVIAWASINQPTGNPIDETPLDNLFFAYDLTRATFSPGEIQKVDAWLRRMADVEIANRNSQAGTATNNWNSHRVKIIGLIGLLLPDQKLIDYAVNGYKQQIADDLNADGSTFDFLERDALHYHAYTLEPLLVLARAAQMNGMDLYHYQAPSGASLDKSVAFLIPYADGTKTHAEFVNSTVAFDRARANAGQASYQAGTLFDPKQASTALEFDYFFDQSVLPLIIRLNGSKVNKYPTFPVLIEDMQR